MSSNVVKHTDYNRLGDKLKLVIDSFACNLKAVDICALITTKFGEAETIKMTTIYAYKRQYQKIILKRRKELGKDIPIMNPANRYQLLQEVVDIAMEGIERFDKQGNSKGMVSDLPSAISALKLAHEMTTKNRPDDIADDDILRQIVTEAFQGLKEQNPESSVTEICAKLIAELPEDAKPFIDELNDE